MFKVTADAMVSGVAALICEPLDRSLIALTGTGSAIPRWYQSGKLTLRLPNPMGLNRQRCVPNQFAKFDFVTPLVEPQLGSWSHDAPLGSPHQ